MADTSHLKMYKTPATNEHFMQCGPPHEDMRKCLENLPEDSKKTRIQWLHSLMGTPLPSGPYPIHIKNRGWFHCYIRDPNYQACYVVRHDLNLDIAIYRVIRGADGEIIDRVQVEDATTEITARVAKACWNMFANLHPEVFKSFGDISEDAYVEPPVLRDLILNEVHSWKLHDQEMHENHKVMVRMKQAKPDDTFQSVAICRGHTDVVLLQKALQPAAPRVTKRRLVFPKGKKKKGQSHHKKGPMSDSSPSWTGQPRPWTKSTRRSPTCSGSLGN